jgi:signal transduction histidine kinase
LDGQEVNLYRPQEREIVVPTINDGVPDIEVIGHILETAREYRGRSIRFRFQKCRFLRPHAIVALTAARDLLELRNVEVSYDYSDCGTSVIRHLERCGFKSTPFEAALPSTMPIARFYKDDPAAIAQYLESEWLALSPISADGEYAKRILSAVGEITDNVFQHADSPIGMIVGGQLFPNMKWLQLIVLDTGMGIPDSVRRRLPRLVGWMKSADALQWAFQSGFSRADSPRSPRTSPTSRIRHAVSRTRARF